MPVAFTTRAGLDHRNVGPISMAGDTFELHTALKEGGGFVVVPDEDTLLISILNEHEALKHSTLKAAEEAAEKASRKAAKKATTEDGEK